MDGVAGERVPMTLWDWYNQQLQLGNVSSEFPNLVPIDTRLPQFAQMGTGFAIGKVYFATSESPHLGLFTLVDRKIGGNDGSAFVCVWTGVYAFKYRMRACTMPYGEDDLMQEQTTMAYQNYNITLDKFNVASRAVNARPADLKLSELNTVQSVPRMIVEDLPTNGEDVRTQLEFGVDYCDAGAVINHSRSSANTEPGVCLVNNDQTDMPIGMAPMVAMTLSRDVNAGDEILFNYGYDASDTFGVEDNSALAGRLLNASSAPTHLVTNVAEMQTLSNRVVRLWKTIYPDRRIRAKWCGPPLRFSNHVVSGLKRPLLTLARQSDIQGYAFSSKSITENKEGVFEVDYKKDASLVTLRDAIYKRRSQLASTELEQRRGNVESLLTMLDAADR
jgi:hypothetical protein